MARCADHALQLGFANEAIAIWERARELSPLNAEQQQQIYSGLIVSLGQTAMWHKMLRVASDTAAPKASDRPIEHTHDDAELALFEAEWQTAGRPDELLPRLLRCARDIEAPPIHRARASVVALTIAHNLPAAPVAKEAHEIVESLAGRGDELVGQQLAADLIYHTAFGSLQKGIDAGRSLMDLTKHGKSFTRFLWALRAAAMPLLYSGDFSGARRLLAEARGLAIECCLFDAAMSATEMIAKSYFQEGNCEAAKDWAAAYREISAPPEGLHRFSLFDPTQAQIDLLEDRPGGAAVRSYNECTSWADVPEIRFRSAAYANHRRFTTGRGAGVSPKPGVQRCFQARERIRGARLRRLRHVGTTVKIRRSGFGSQAITTLH